MAGSGGAVSDAHRAIRQRGGGNGENAHDGEAKRLLR